ncbi:MAG: bifunctional phosphopantothenoylcysteine decarboxylase/phosphopantothenate--cysteine ligase CoaBC [Magnetococcales bacterium]|nr:bifunctional phosphopantothenoylcysteine decarboxylase/phosphopantothenate--cysteine ligase CoaBC [Magnetococcales bacterium]
MPHRKITSALEFRLRFWKEKRLLLGISGGIAACKTPELIRLCREAGATVTVVVTEAALQFVTRTTLEALSGGPVHGDLFAPGGSMEHIHLGRETELVILAPATADLLARMAAGIGNDLLTTLLLAHQGPVLAAPAMNCRMWRHPATRRNVALLQGDGLHLVGPETGTLACGEEGEGRMAEPPAILEAGRRLLTPQILAGKHLLMTVGPTREALDPVRYLTNHSSGKMGMAIAAAALRAGARVSLVHGPTASSPPSGATAIPVTSAREMAAATLGLWPDCDAAILTAAVADYRPATSQAQKMKKDGSGAALTLELVENPDILATLSARRAAPPPPGSTPLPASPLLVGFAAETGSALDHGREKLRRKGCDLLVVNDVAEAGSGFGEETNRVSLLWRDGREEHWPLLTKAEVGERLVAQVAAALAITEEK